MIAIIDYGAGNVRSVANACARIVRQARVTNQPDDIHRAEAVIFPGVGAAAHAMEGLRKYGLDDAIRRRVESDRPLLAICVGMQVLFESTEEDGGCSCLAALPGSVKRLPNGLKVPHMGWNQVRQEMKHAIFDGIDNEENFYFVHSYYVAPERAELVAGVTEYGVSMCSVLVKDNLIATQFHPERSGESGIRMYKNFLKMAGIKGG